MPRTRAMATAPVAHDAEGDGDGRVRRRGQRAVAREERGRRERTSGARQVLRPGSQRRRRGCECKREEWRHADWREEIRKVLKRGMGLGIAVIEG